MSRPIQRDLIARVQFGELHAVLVTHGTPYSPDVIDDLVRRVGDLWKTTVATAMESGMLEAYYDPDDDDDDDDEDDGETASES